MTVARRSAPLTDADLAGVPTLLHGQRFEEMIPGSRFRTASRTITETDLVTFVTLTGMNEPLFLDEAGSLEARLQRAAWYPARWCSPTPRAWSCRRGHPRDRDGVPARRLSVQAPVFVGDTITVVVEVDVVARGLDGRRAAS